MKKKTDGATARAFKGKAANDPERTKADILAVATEEFASHGLSGARVDRIAARTRTSKRMIYYYFSGKQGLYRAVIEKAYGEIRSLDSQVPIADLAPQDAIRRIIDITFDYDDQHPHFIRLVSVENIHHARNIAKSAIIKERNATVIRTLALILANGRAAGVFRSDVAPLDVHLLISALCFFRVSNRHTFGTVFNCDLSEPATRRRHRKMIVEAVLRYLAA